MGYVWWLQGLMCDCLVADAELLRLWDLFIFEQSHKIFLRTAVAVFGLLEKNLRKLDVEKMIQFLFEPQAWQLEEGAIIAAALNTKVTRSMLREIEQRTS